jgi:hypothetical protein
MDKNVRQFLLNEAIAYYQQIIAPDLYCLGVSSEPLLYILEELALEISPELVLNEQQQQLFLGLLIDISTAMFDRDRTTDLINYKQRLKLFLEEGLELGVRQSQWDGKLPF